MQNDKTAHLQLPLPHEDNLLEDDVIRLRQSLALLDSSIQNIASTLASDDPNLNNVQILVTTLKSHAVSLSQLQSGKVSAEDMTKALQAVNASIAQAQNAANAAQKAANGAQGTANAASTAAGNAQGTANAANTAAVGAQNTANAAWTAANEAKSAAIAAQGAIAKMSPLGCIKLQPFRWNELPFGWYFCNGTRYGNGSPQGIALNALPANLRIDWGITNNGSTTNVPNWFSNDGRGPAIRAVNGSNRQVGSIEDGAMQHFTGDVGSMVTTATSSTHNGVLIKEGQPAFILNTSSGGLHGVARIVIDSARQVVSANETRMLNRGMTPAIYLGM